MTAAIRLPGKPARIRIAPKADRIYNGHVYHSKAEAKQAAELDLLMKCGEIVGWERQLAFPLRVRGEYICTMVIDFKVYPRRGQFYLLEVKGHETELYRLKRKLLKACYPGIDFRQVDV